MALAWFSAPVAAAASTATASATILEPALVPTFAALPEAARHDGTARVRQVNSVRADRLTVRRESAVWPVIIEFE